MVEAKKSKARMHPLQLVPVRLGPGSVESAHRGRVASPPQAMVARACEQTCGSPCNLR